jgi:hypothetical protein
VREWVVVLVEQLPLVGRSPQLCTIHADQLLYPDPGRAHLTPWQSVCHPERVKRSTLWTFPDRRRISCLGNGTTVEAQRRLRAQRCLRRQILRCLGHVSRELD